MSTILTVVGARPQFIKASIVSRSLNKQRGIAEIMVHTGQHHDVVMSDVFFEELAIPTPRFHLGIRGGGHGEMTGAMLQRLEALMLEQRPDAVLVYGDTNSTLAGALAASKLHIPVAHVEAGLRSFNRRMPEEQNRVLTDHVSDWLFTPTDTATANLRNEGISGASVYQVGDVMYDAALSFGEVARERTQVLETYGVSPGGYVLATIHRAENADDESRLRIILESLDAVARELPVLLLLHPRTREAIGRYGIMTRFITLLEPVGYLEMVALECQAGVIATDSGGVQKEAFFHGVPCVTLRDETEWVELVHMGWNRLAKPGKDDIGAAVREALNRHGDTGTPYGSGCAADRIAGTLCDGVL